VGGLRGGVCLTKTENPKPKMKSGHFKGKRKGAPVNEEVGTKASWCLGGGKKTESLSNGLGNRSCGGERKKEKGKRGQLEIKRCLILWSGRGGRALSEYFKER